jgi:crotonobetainyl-CoA:carnitine CoA-transferase CaiB-like acyl-CoA transferase
MTPFGDDGPWAKFEGSDLIHLALGGVMMNCGYDPDPSLHYDLPPIAPQLWHAYHIAGEQLVVAALAALLHRLRTGEGQDVSCAVHEAVSKNNELDLMSWVMRRAPLHRLTCRHAMEQPNTRRMSRTPRMDAGRSRGASVRETKPSSCHSSTATTCARTLSRREPTPTCGPAMCQDRPEAASARPTFSKSSSDSLWS